MKKDVLYIINVPDLPPILGLDVQLFYGDLAFSDTIRGHQLGGELIHDDENGFTWHWTANGEERGIITGTRLTARMYDEIFRPGIMGDVPPFKDDDEMNSWYQNNFKLTY